jgi:limonene-1,2-epoxide hydrolase
VSTQTTQSTQSIEQFFARWAMSNNELNASFRDSFADGAEWHAGPPPIPVTHGAVEALGLMDAFKAQHDLTTIDVDVVNIARAGAFVYTERVDHLVNSSGERFLSIPVAGVMQLDDADRIAYWHDYWDMQEFLALGS